MVRVTELIDQPLASLSFLHDSLLVILPERPGQLVIVHSWSVLNENERLISSVEHFHNLNIYLSLAPESGHLDRVDDLEDPLLPVDPVDVVAIGRGLQQQFLDKLPEMDVGAGPS